MIVADLLLSREAILEKYAGKGSPDYPTHPEGCPCSGCYASWTEWRGAAALRPVVAERDARIERLEATLKHARKSLGTAYGHIDADREVKAMKMIRNITDVIDSVVGAK